MKKLILATFLFSAMFAGSATAQESNDGENFGNTLNIGVGIGYYGYIGQTLPVLHANYEFNVARNFTLAPFITMYSYKKYYNWGNPNDGYKDYYYRTTVIPVGVKGSYYFDQFLGAGSRWDFYLAGSLGFAIRKTVWENGYNGDYVASNSTSGLYLDAHIGTEFHASEKIGLFLDLSTGLSTFGLAVHF